MPSDCNISCVVVEKSGEEEPEQSKDYMLIRTGQGRREENARVGFATICVIASANYSQLALTQGVPHLAARHVSLV